MAAPHTAPSVVARQIAALVTVALVVLWFDQVGKAWGWRNSDVALVDTGGGALVGGHYGDWWADPTAGPALDVLMGMLLLAAAALVVRRGRPPLVLAGAVVCLAGWTSNLADRFGLHSVTAPGSVRGVVDYLAWDGRVWNLADAAIALGAALYVTGLLIALVRRVATAWRVAGARTRPAPAVRATVDA